MRMLDRLSSFSRKDTLLDMSSLSIKISGTSFTNSRVLWMISLQDIRILLRGLHYSTSMLNGAGNGLLTSRLNILMIELRGLHKDVFTDRVGFELSYGHYR